MRSCAGPRIVENRGSGVARIIAALSAGGVRNATAMSASERSHPPGPKLSSGTLATVQPINTPPAIAFADTASQSASGAVP